MNLILNLPPGTEQLLRQQAAAVGAPPEEFALRALEAQLAAAKQNGPPVLPPSEELSAEEWIADIRQWAESHRRLDHEADDSRESIYSDGGL